MSDRVANRYVEWRRLSTSNFAKVYFIVPAVTPVVRIQELFNHFRSSLRSSWMARTSQRGIGSNTEVEAK